MSDRDAEHMLSELQEARAEVERLEKILEACWRYFDHCRRITPSALGAARDSKEVVVRISLQWDAETALGMHEIRGKEISDE